MKDECKDCGCLKEERYKRNSYCKKCTIERNKIWRLQHPGYSKKDWEVSKKRKIRNEFCIKCGTIKEEKWRHTSYCAKCASKRAREWELKNKDKVKVSNEKNRLKRQTTTCVECGTVFERKRGEDVCSVKCMILNRKQIDTNGCWNYPIINSRKYGQISFRGKKGMLAHRESYKLFKGSISQNKFVCHKCDNPSCCNPEHLFLGTAKENVQDGIKKGRIKHLGAKGRDCRFTNLTEIQIDEMRKLFDEGLNYERLSRIFKCTKQYVSKIIRKKTRF